MFRIKRIIPAVLFLLTLVICGCDAGLEVTGIEITRLPDKTVYKCGADTELDLTGGEIAIAVADGDTSTYSMNSGECEIEHEIDFDRAGEYKVTVRRWEFTDEFTVTVE